jgi:hypothetical protein
MTKKRENDDDATQINVTSYNQSGGITAHTVVNQRPEPKITRGRQLVRNQEVGGSSGSSPLSPARPPGYVTKWEVAVESDYALPQLTIVASAPSIQRVDLTPAGGGFAAVTEIPPENGEAGGGLANAHGTLILCVQTAEPEDSIQLEARIG